MARPEDVDNPSRDPNVDNENEIEDYTIPEQPLGATQWGTTAWEQEHPESVLDRLDRESAESLRVDNSRPNSVGRLTRGDDDFLTDVTSEEIAEDVGDDSGDFSAEESAMHEVSDE